MAEPREAFVGIDAAKLRNAVAVADAGRDGEVRFFGEVDASPEGMRRLAAKLAARYDRLTFCYEAGPTGYGLHRLLTDLGHSCMVVAPSLIPRKPSDRVKTNRRDALTLARLLRAGELTAVWVPDTAHEAMRNLVRARTAAVKDVGLKKRQVSAFLLRHSRIFPRLGIIRHSLLPDVQVQPAHCRLRPGGQRRTEDIPPGRPGPRAAIRLRTRAESTRCRRLAISFSLHVFSVFTCACTVPYETRSSRLIA
jgi:transposase